MALEPCPKAGQDGEAADGGEVDAPAAPPGDVEAQAEAAEEEPAESVDA